MAYKTIWCIFVSMFAVITGDLVHSASADPKKWMPALRDFLKKQGASPGDWEIFRGDSFQFRCAPAEAFGQFLLLKSRIKQIEELDVRVSIGLGDIDFEADRISESNGSAFLRSGRSFDNMKDKELLVFSTGDETADRTLNLLARFASLSMDNWSSSVAETVHIALEHPEWNQQTIAEKLQIAQPAVSQNLKRAQLDLLQDLNEFYISSVTSLPA